MATARGLGGVLGIFPLQLGNTFEDFPFLCKIAHLHPAVVTALEHEERWCRMRRNVSWV